jgi:KaiC/GvpD/RAD55 family RecA-like ATPase
MQRQSKYDVFISHASEEKEDVARPLAALLIQLGLKVWLDEAELLLGDSLRRQIESGLTSSRFGLVILSKSFFAKEWPQKELDALVAREDGLEKVILPVWHNVSRSEVAKHSPLLADKLASNTDAGLTNVAAAVLKVAAPARDRSACPTESQSTTPAQKSKRHGPRSIDQLVVEFIDRVTQKHDDQIEVDGLRTGFHDLDRLTTGLQSGELYVVAARPSVGSTTFCLNIAHYVATEEGLPVLFFSSRAKASEIVNRLIASAGRIDRWHLATGRLIAEEWERLADAVEQVHKTALYVDDTTSMSVTSVIDGTIARRSELGALGLVVVDGFDGLSLDDEPRSEEIALRRLWELAREIQCPMILTMPVSRSAETRIDKRPILSDLSSSESLERIAAGVILLHRDDYYNRDSTHPGVVEVIVARNRGGLLGTINLAFIKPLARMDNIGIAPEETPPSDAADDA